MDHLAGRHSDIDMPRLEQRTSDAAANPYLAAAAVLHAARLGVEQDLELPAVQPVAGAPNSDVRIPPTLESALDALAADKELVTALGEEMVEAFTILKRAEWERYLAAVGKPDSTEASDWEIAYYLPFH